MAGNWGFGGACSMGVHADNMCTEKNVLDPDVCTSDI